MDKPDFKFPVLILAAKPQNEISTIPNFFDSRGPFFQILQKPEYLRYSGWNLRTIDTPSIRDGNAWKVENGDRKLIILYQNLSLLTGSSLGPDFLGWGSTEENVIRINSVAIAEYVYEFANLFYRIIKSAEVPITSCKINITMMDVGKSSQRIELGINPIVNAIQFPGKLLSEDFTKAFEVDFKTYDPKKVGFQILNFIFLQFGYPSDTVMPYTNFEKKEIDVDGILKIGG